LLPQLTATPTAAHAIDKCSELPAVVKGAAQPMAAAAAAARTKAASAADHHQNFNSRGTAYANNSCDANCVRA